MSQHLPPLIAALLEPGCYPEPAENVELIETHISWVFLVGDIAYKIKKPIHLPFLDYSTLERRQFYCQTEVKLNRRFSPELYLGVVGISGTFDKPQVGELNIASAQALEYAVKMKRFDESNRLDHLCNAGQLSEELITRLVEPIAKFHSSATKAAIGSRYGSLESVMLPALKNLEQLKSLLTSPADVTILSELNEWTHAEYIRLVPQFLRRKAAGYIRECHGDLHMANVAVLDGIPTLFDCIEFSEDLRWIDVASDIAFLYVDLLDHKQPGLAGWLMNQWLSLTGDYEAIPVLRYYCTYRALVRAKVAAIRARQIRGDYTEARRHLALALQLIRPMPPTLTITYGLSGSGKTVAAKARLISDTLGATLCLRSDIERKRLFGLAANATSGSPLGEGIYNPEANTRTYRQLHKLATQLLKARWSVIVDAAFLRHSERINFRELATQLKARFFILAPMVAEGDLETRIMKRLQENNDASEANLEVLRDQRMLIEALDESERACLVTNA